MKSLPLWDHQRLIVFKGVVYFLNKCGNSIEIWMHRKMSASCIKILDWYFIPLINFIGHLKKWYWNFFLKNENFLYYLGKQTFYYRYFLLLITVIVSFVDRQKGRKNERKYAYIHLYICIWISINIIVFSK